MIDLIRTQQIIKNTKTKGDISEYKVIARLLELGHKLLLPVGEDSRYDLLIDLNGDFKRVQIKTGRYKDGYVAFATQSNRKSGDLNISRNYNDQIDYFIVYCLQLNSFYIIEPNDVTDGNAIRLRVDPSKNNQSKGIRWAKDYSL